LFFTYQLISDETVAALGLMGGKKTERGCCCNVIGLGDPSMEWNGWRINKKERREMNQ
jgi:hypothetical protein